MNEGTPGERQSRVGSISNISFKICVVVEPDGDQFHAYCPALTGLHTCGDTEEEALDNARDAAIAYLHSLIKHGDPIPVGVLADKEKEKMGPHRIEDLVVTTV